MAEIDEIRKAQAEQNAIIKEWTEMAARQMNIAMADQKLVDTGRLFKSLRWKFRQNFGAIDRISFVTKRYGFILIHAGENYTWTSNSGVRKINKSAIKRDWFYEMLKEALPELGTQLAETNADALVSASRILSTAEKLRF